MKPVQTAVSYLGQSSDYVTAPCDGTNLGIDPHVQPNPPPLLNCTKTYQPTYQYHAFPPFYRDLLREGKLLQPTVQISGQCQSARAGEICTVNLRR